MRKIELDFSKEVVLQFINISDVTISGKVYVELEGQDGGNSYPFSVTDTTGTKTPFLIPQNMQGVLKTLTVILDTPNINEGQFFAIQEIYRGSYLLSDPIDCLFSEYVTSEKFIGYPFSKIKSPQDTKGNFKRENFTSLLTDIASFTNSKQRLIDITNLYFYCSLYDGDTDVYANLLQHDVLANVISIRDLNTTAIDGSTNPILNITGSYNYSSSFSKGSNGESFLIFNTEKILMIKSDNLILELVNSDGSTIEKGVITFFEKVYI